MNELWPDGDPGPDPEDEPEGPPIPTWHRDAEYWIGSISGEEVARIWMGKPAKSLPRDPDGYLTIHEAAAYLHQSRSWIYQQIRSGGLPTYGPRGNQKIRRNELEAWMAGRRQRTAGQRRASVEDVLARLTPRGTRPLPTRDIKCKISDGVDSQAEGPHAKTDTDSEGTPAEP